MSKRLDRLLRYRPFRPGESQPAPSSWQRTLIVVWVTEFLSLIGFAMVMPFLPFYVQELGVRDPAQVKVWSGLLVSVQAVTMGIFAPIWGSLADRYGRKLMLERATFGAAVLMALMAFAKTPEQLLLLRALQGCLTGTVTAATALVASIVPRERTGFALGWLQMGVFAGVSVGPLVGGLLADNLGYRMPFLVTGVCLFLAGLGVLFFIHERFERPTSASETQRSRWWDGLAMVVRSRALLVVFSARMLVRTGTRSLSPVLPLFVAALLPEESRVATMTGLVTGSGAAASAIGAVLLGQTGDRIGYRRVMITSAAAAAILYALQSTVTDITQLILLRVCVGVAFSGIISSLAALLATLAPEGQQGAVYGADTSVVSGANAVGPMLGAYLAVALGIRATFLLAAGAFALAAAVIGWLLPAPQTSAKTSSESVPHYRDQRTRKIKSR
jgi:DHA1 family multidrug resistance protein-like MFS transporter